MKLLLSTLALLVTAQAHAIDFKSPSVRFLRYEQNQNAVPVVTLTDSF